MTLYFGSKNENLWDVAKNYNTTIEAIRGENALNGDVTEKDGMLLVDGGLLARGPCEYVKNMGADVVVAVDVLGNLATLEKKPSTVTVLLESYNIMDNYRTAMRRKEQESIIDFWLEPPLGSMNQYSLKQLEFALEEGYKLGKENAQKIKKAIEE